MRSGQRPPRRSPPEPRSGLPGEGAERGCGLLCEEAERWLSLERLYLGDDDAGGVRAPSRDP
jgi:hypothetical protein